MKKLFRSGNFALFNLAMVGLIVGFVLAMVLFSASPAIRPARVAYAQETQPADTGLLQLQSSFRAISSAIVPAIVKIDVEQVSEGDSSDPERTPWFDFFFGRPDEQGEREFRRRGLGSGVIVRRDASTYYVLTNAHVVGEADTITIILDGGSDFNGALIGRDLRKDIALLSFRATENIPVAALGDSDNLQVGDWVLAIGSPFDLQSTVTAGIVSALGRSGGPDGNINDFIQTDAAINQGNSGGALVNLQGQVIGINTWITSRTGLSMGFGFAIPINNVKRAIDDFIDNGELVYGWLGVSIRTIGREYATGLGIDRQDGALIPHVFRASPADRAGLLPGDFILSIDDRPIKSANDLALVVGDLAIGSEARVRLIRQGNETTLTVRIGERADAGSIAALNRNLWPGVEVTPLTEQVRRTASIPSRVSGVQISNVENRSPAAIAGLQIGDTVTSVNDRQVTTISDFYKALNDNNEKRAAVEFLRDGQTMNIEFAL